MKIKGCSTSIRIKEIPFILCLASLVGIVVRSFQILKYIDVETGFYEGGTFFAGFLYGFIVVISIAFCVMSFLSAESEKIQLTGVQNKTVGVATLVFAASLFLDFASTFLSSASSLGGTDFKAMMLSGEIPERFRSIFALFASVYFIILGLDFLKGTANASKRKILALTPVAWAGFKMIGHFVRQISFIRVSDLLLELVMLALMILFFMAIAQVASGVYSEGFGWRIPALGASAALLSLIIYVPRLIFTFVNHDGFINANHPFRLADFVFAIFAAVLIKAISENLSPYTADDYESNDETGE